MLSVTAVAVNDRHFVNADDSDKELEKIEDEIEDTKDEISQLSEKINGIKGEIDNLSGSLSQVLATISSVEAEINEIIVTINKVTTELNSHSATLTSQTVIRDRTLRNFYKKGPSGAVSTIIRSNALLSSESDTSGYLRKYINDSTDFITKVNEDILGTQQNKAALEIVKADVESERAKLLEIKAQKEAELAKQQEELAAKNASLGELNSKLSGLEARQKEILAAKEGNFYASLGSGVETDDPNASPNYNPGFSPAFGAFSYGAYTHYKGMSQYGAKGRAEDGQDYKDIIEFYYDEGVETKDNFPDRVCVEGHGEMDFQKYLYGLAEMPDSFPMEALKAQAIAGRSYAYRYQQQGKCICTSQNCQVYLQSKADNPPSKWKEAVDDTDGKIVGGGVVTYYSSTAGGYIDNIGWDTDGDWPGDAYEKKGGSPWFYKGWYTKTYNKNSDKCGRDHPWLDEEEMADIINAYLYTSEKGGDSRVSPVSCWGGDPYSHSELADKAEDEYGASVSDVKSVSVSFSNNGFTSSVKVETDIGTLNLDGPTFKDVFNLRAPGYIAIRSRLFDIEKK
jgi:peptidoglycan hydrolase CwlO-like protein